MSEDKRAEEKASAAAADTKPTAAPSKEEVSAYVNAPTVDIVKEKSDIMLDEARFSAPTLPPALTVPAVAPVAPPTAALPVEPQPPAARPPAAPSRMLAIANHVAAVVIAFGVAFSLIRNEPSISTTAGPWLTALGHPATADDAPFSGILRFFAAHLGNSAHSAVGVWQWLWAGTLLLMLWHLLQHLRNWLTAAVALAALVAWPTSRELLTTFGSEIVLITGSCALALAALHLQDRPIWAVLVGGTGLGVLAMAHPIGPFVALPLLLVPLLLPAQPAANDQENGDLQGFAARPVWLPWLALVLVALAVMSRVAGKDALKQWLAGALTVLRAPVSGLQMGWASSLPLLGPLVALAAQIPISLLLPASGALARGARQRSQGLAPLAGTVLAWLVVLAFAGHPLPGILDSLLVLSPFVVVLAVMHLHDIMLVLLDDQVKDRRTQLAVFGVMLVLAAWADVRLGRDDRRTLLGRIPQVLSMTAPIRPAAVTPADIDLLTQTPDTTAIFPGRPGGNRLGAALKTLRSSMQPIAYAAPFASHLALVPAASSSIVEATFRELGQPVMCTPDKRSCLVRLTTGPLPK